MQKLNQVKNINFDMDGVLVDLSKGLSQLDGFDDPVMWYMHKYSTDGNALYIKSIERHLESECFYKCPPMPRYEEMKNLIEDLLTKDYKINILSSCMDKPYSDIIVEQKINWLKTHYNDYFKYFNEVNIVRGSQLKINYICDQSLLIDDYHKTHNSFIENGKGHQFILYKNFDDCKQKLNELNII